MSYETATLLDDEIPAKFKDPQTGALNAQALLSSYKELERKDVRASGRAKMPRRLQH